METLFKLPMSWMWVCPVTSKTVIVPWTDSTLVSRLVRFLRAEGFDPQPVWTKTDYSYWETLQQQWKREEKFIIVEHDVVPFPGALQSLWDCSHNYCGFPYRLRSCSGVSTALGCTKFSAELQKSYPGLLDDIAKEEGTRFVNRCAPTHWSSLDGSIKILLNQHIHGHFPAVTHLI